MEKLVEHPGNPVEQIGDAFGQPPGVTQQRLTQTLEVILPPQLGQTNSVRICRFFCVLAEPPINAEGSPTTRTVTALLQPLPYIHAQRPSDDGCHL